MAGVVPSAVLSMCIGAVTDASAWMKRPTLSMGISGVTVAVDLLVRKRVDWEKACCELEVSRGSNEPQRVGALPKEQRKYWIKRMKEEWEEEAERLPERTRGLLAEKQVFPNPCLEKRMIELFCLLNVATDGILLKLKRSGELQKDKRLPMVDGEVEVIEIKCEGASIPPHQVKNYSKVVRKGYPLHYFHVNFINFEKNRFEIRERVITNSNKVRYRV